MRRYIEHGEIAGVHWTWQLLEHGVQDPGFRETQFGTQQIILAWDELSDSAKRCERWIP